MITAGDIQNAPDNFVFIFGDNLEKAGYGGQAAVARSFVICGKAFGIPTKRKPMNTPDSFFSDGEDEAQAIAEAMAEIMMMALDGKHVVFFPGIGEGYARMAEKSPNLLRTIKTFIDEMCKRFEAEVRFG